MAGFILSLCVRMSERASLLQWGRWQQAGRQACRWSNSCKLISIHKPETKRANSRNLKAAPKLHTSSSMTLTPNSTQTATIWGSSTHRPETETSHSNPHPLFSSYLPFCVCLFVSLPRTVFFKIFIVSFF